VRCFVPFNPDTVAFGSALALLLVFLIAMPTFSRFSFDPVRHAQYAGTWYEGNSDKLKAQLDGFLSAANHDMPAPHAVAPKELLAIISPHAGYSFSGKTAAYGYEAARTAAVKRVFVLGPSHHVALHGVALPTAQVFETPLGNLSVDNSVISELKDYPLFSFEPDVHKVEHSLEMQLPFVRESFGDVKIVPLIVGALKDESEIRLVAEILKGFIGKGDLIIVSSDFTHYGPRYGYTPFPSYSHEKIEALDKEAFQHLSTADLQGFINFHARTEDTICGLYPCAVLCAMLPEDARGDLLKYATSQDVLADDKENSVSYLAISFKGTSWPEHPSQRLPAEQVINLSAEDRQTLLVIARRALETWVKEKRVLDPRAEKDLKISAAIAKCFGAFVTLYKTTGEEPRHDMPRLHLEQTQRELRGCIGNIWPVKPLYQTVVDNAIASSSKDFRFDAVRPDELSQIEIEISVLTPPRRAKSADEIVIGTDGVILAKSGHQAVFLPQVATEFGWDRDETLRQLCVKAGLKENDWQEGAKFDLFQSISIEETHSDSDQRQNP
jgi:AmmeMemoRadiSam system protein B/AmmeMemoRadiSam system protein A